MVSFQFFSLSALITLSLFISAGGAVPLNYTDSVVTHLEKRDKDNGPPECFFKWTKAVQLKDNGSVFRNKCVQRRDKMAIPVVLGNPDVKQVFVGTFIQCKKFDTNSKGVGNGNCQCDHLLEPSEVLGMFADVIQLPRPAQTATDVLQPDEVQALCSVLGGTKSGEDMRKALNSGDNLAGLFGGNQQLSVPNSANQEKNRLLSSPANVKQTANYNKRRWAFEIAAEHMGTYKSNRQATAKKVDSLLLEWDKTVTASANAKAKEGWARVVKSIGIKQGKTPVETLAVANTDKVLSLVKISRPGTGAPPVIKRVDISKTLSTSKKSATGTPKGKKAVKSPATKAAGSVAPAPATVSAPKRKASSSSASSTSPAKKQKLTSPSTSITKKATGSSSAKKVVIPVNKNRKTTVKPVLKPVSRKKS